jgi:hypothetical protein
MRLVLGFRIFEVATQRRRYVRVQHAIERELHVARRHLGLIQLGAVGQRHRVPLHPFAKMDRVRERLFVELPFLGQARHELVGVCHVAICELFVNEALKQAGRGVAGRDRIERFGFVGIRDAKHVGGCGFDARGRLAGRHLTRLVSAGPPRGGRVGDGRLPRDNGDERCNGSGNQRPMMTFLAVRRVHARVDTRARSELATVTWQSMRPA